MKALLIADLHGDQKFLNKLQSIIEKYDLVLCAGDLTNFGNPPDYYNQLSDVVGPKTFFWVSGNNDVGQSYQYLKSNLVNIDGQIVKYQGYKFAGLGGSAPNYEGQSYGLPAVLPCPKSLHRCRRAAQLMQAGPTLDRDTDLSDTILITHVPPSRPLHYQKTDIVCHPSPAVRYLVPPIRHPDSASCHPELFSRHPEQGEGSGRTLDLNHAPLVHLCGHIHNIFGVACIETTKVVKIGTAQFGQWAEMDLEKLSVKFYTNEK